MSMSTLALDQAVWAAPLLILAGTIVTAGLGFMTTLLVKKMSRRGDDAQAFRLEVEAEALAEKAEDDDRDRDLIRMQKTIDFAWSSLDRLAVQVESYERQIDLERDDRNAQFAKHVAASQQQFDALQEQADRRHEFVLAEVEELRGQLSGTRAKIREHRPWDERVARMVRERIDTDFPDPPDL